MKFICKVLRLFGRAARERAGGPKYVRIQGGSLHDPLQELSLAWFDRDEPGQDAEHIQKLRRVLLPKDEANQLRFAFAQEIERLTAA